MFLSRKPERSENSIQVGPEGFVHLTYNGPQTKQTLVTLKPKLLEVLEDIRKRGEKVRVLANMRAITSSDSSARLEAKWFLEEADYDSLAIVGNRYLQPLVFFVLRDFNRPNKLVRYFTDERSALNWLANPTSGTHINSLKPRGRVGWGVTAVLILLLFAATFYSWRQADERIKGDANTRFSQVAQRSNEAVEERLVIYLEALEGFRGLFHASDEVNEREYQDYFNSLGLINHHPGVNSVNFISRVTKAEKSAFVQRMITDRSLRPEGDPDFAIVPDSQLQEHFVVTFVGVDGAGSDRGVDLAVSDERRVALEKARDSGGPVATETIELLDSQGRPQQNKKGFLISIPVYQDNVPETLEARRAAHQGFVNAVFDYEKFFNEALVHVNLKDIAIRILDGKGTTIYSRGALKGRTLSATTPISVAGQTLSMQVSAPPLFGLSRSEKQGPGGVITFGIILVGFLIVVLWLQNRGRKQAISLASSATEDLKMERNEAVTTKNKVEAILSSIGDGVFVLDKEGKVLRLNRAAESMSGFSSREAAGRHFREIFVFTNEKTGQSADAFIDTALAGQADTMPAKTILRRKDGKVVPVADSAAPVLDGEGHKIGAVVVFRDITRERQLEQMKEDLLSVASHELRTPMGAVRANVSMILSGDYGPVNKDLVEPLTDIKASTVRLVELVNDLLGVARLEAGRMKFTLGEFDIQPVLKAEVNNMAALGKEKNVEVIFTPGKPAKVQADTDKIKQILTNLLGNALKFTDKGRITVASEDQGNMVEVSVTDTGVGISPEDQNKLFGKFQQISSVQDGKPAGTGLGLYISREMIRKMGGELFIKQSTPGKGSTFAFTVPLVSSAEASLAKERVDQESQMHPDQK